MPLNRLVGLLLLLFVLAAYATAPFNDFVQFDDPVYVTQNPQVQQGLSFESVKWAFTTTYANFYHPLTWLSHLIDWHLFEDHPAGHHFTAQLLHAINTLLLFIVMLRMTGELWPSAMVAAIFGLHPAHVESVAWVAERKDVLSGTFWMLTMWAYVCYAQRPNIWRYALTVLCFILGLLAKPMLVTLPFLLLILDVWPLSRRSIGSESHASWLRLIVEKLPLLALAIAAAAVAYIAQERGGAITDIDALTLRLRIENAIVSYVRYLGMLFWPIDLAVFYPHPIKWPAWRVGASLGVLIAITAVAIVYAKRRPYLLVGWLWYLGTLVPVIGLVQVGRFAMADRYTYIPFIGLSVMIVWFAAEIARRPQARAIVRGVATVALVACFALTFKQVTIWRDSITLIEHSIRVTGPTGMMLNNLASSYIEIEDYDQAMRHLQEARKLDLGLEQVHHNIGLVLVRTGRTDESIEHFENALILEPDYVKVHLSLAHALRDLKRYDEAIKHYNTALRLEPGSVPAMYNLGYVYAQQREFGRSIEYYRLASEKAPQAGSILNTLAWLLATAPDDKARNGEEAVRLARRAIEIAQTPDADMMQTLAAALAEAGRFDEAVQVAGQALQLARSENNQRIEQSLVKQIELYRSRQPYRSGLIASDEITEEKKHDTP